MMIRQQAKSIRKKNPREKLSSVNYGNPELIYTVIDFGRFVDALPISNQLAHYHFHAPQFTPFINSL